MKKTKLLIIPAFLCLTGLMGCSKVINSFNSILHEGEESEEGGEEESQNQSQGGGELSGNLSSILKKINDRNYFLDFSAVSTVSINYTYQVDGYHVYVPSTGDYYDYTNADRDNEYEYYEFDDIDEVYYHGYSSLAMEPGYSRLITRARLNTSDFVKTNVVDEYTMVDAKLAEYGLSAFKIVYSARNETISYAGQGESMTGSADFIFNGKFYNFGQASVSLPTDYLEEF